MTPEQTFVDSGLWSWRSNMDRVGKFFGSLTNEDFELQVAPAEPVRGPHPNRYASLLNKVPAEMRSSMQKDVKQGNSPELDAIAGPILRGGENFGIAVPTTKRLVQQIERLLQRTMASTVSSPRAFSQGKNYE
jgi:hypothetical protein